MKWQIKWMDFSRRLNILTWYWMLWGNIIYPFLPHCFKGGLLDKRILANRSSQKGGEGNEKWILSLSPFTLASSESRLLLDRYIEKLYSSLRNWIFIERLSNVNKSRIAPTCRGICFKICGRFDVCDTPERSPHKSNDGWNNWDTSILQWSKINPRNSTIVYGQMWSIWGNSFVSH